MTSFVVTRGVPPYTIAGGTPAKPLRRRFSPETAARLQALSWWDWPGEKLRRRLPAIQKSDLDTLENT